MSQDQERVAAAITTAAAAAANEVYDFAAGFDKRADYRPLEELAQRVMGRACRAGAEAYNATGPQ